MSGPLEVLREAARLGINHGRSGNASVRTARGMRITPSGVAYDGLTDADLVEVDLVGRFQGRPSSERGLHLGIYRQREDVGAVLHLHSPAATALSCLREPLPAFHYMVAVAGGNRVECARYATFGTNELAHQLLKALGPRKAVLLANHGLVTTGRDPREALEVAIEIEALCDAYLRARTVREPVLLTEAEMADVHARFEAYRAGCA